LGLQLVGAPFAESLLLSAARWAERQFEPMPAPDSIALAPASNSDGG
jgi:hypothetical protein